MASVHFIIGASILAVVAEIFMYRIPCNKKDSESNNTVYMVSPRPFALDSIHDSGDWKTAINGGNGQRNFGMFSSSAIQPSRSSELPYLPPALSLEESPRKPSSGPRYQYVPHRDEQHIPLSDIWEMVADIEDSRYDPDLHNQYHLYTRQNPMMSHPIVLGNQQSLITSHFNPKRRTVVLVHGWMGCITSKFYRNLVSALLGAEDVNVIVVDWTFGANSVVYTVSIENSVASGESIARFLTWLNQKSGASPSQYHIIGNSLGGHVAGIVSRNMNREIAYVTALDPALPGWLNNVHRFRADDGVYTEVIHTNAGFLGFHTPLGQVDFYPNGGTYMPNCIDLDIDCNHSQAQHYFVESIRSGGFKSKRCSSYLMAMSDNCNMPESLRMGGLKPKTGQSGVYWLQTNEAPPFSRG